MKNNKLFFTSLFILLNYISTIAQIGIGTTTPRGALEINSSTNGFVPPQVQLTSSTTAAPVINPQGGDLLAGTIVYNINTAGTSPNNVIPGYYFWNGTQWERLSSQTSAPSMTEIRTVLRIGSTGNVAPTLTEALGNISLLNFNRATKEAYITLELPPNWKEGSNIYPSINWMPISDAAPADVVWYLDYTWVNAGEIFPTSTQTITTTSSASAKYKNIESSFPSISGIEKKTNSILMGRLYRLGADDPYTGNAGALSVSFDIITN